MAEKVFGALHGLAQKAKSLDINVDKLAYGLLTLAFGLTPAGKFYPFGWALFLACEGQSGLMLGVLCLCCVLNGSAVLGVTVAIGLYAFKKLLPTGGGRTAAKLGAGTAAAAFLCIAQLEQGVYGLAQGVATLSLVPMFTLLYGLYLTPETHSNTATSQAGLAALLFTATLCLNTALPWSLPVQALALTVTIAAARSGGMLCGGFFGFVCGLACDAGTAAMLGICGLVTGLLLPAGAFVAVPIGCLAGMCTGLYFFGTNVAAQVILCFALGGILYFIFGNKLQFLPISAATTPKETATPNPPPFAEAFHALSQSARIAACNKDSAARAADDYASFSSLLAHANKKQEDEEQTDTALSEKAAIMLRGAGIHAETVKVIGGRRKRLEADGVAIDGINLSSEQLKELTEQVLGCGMKAPEFFIKNGKAALVMESAPLYRIECSRTGVCKDGEKISGDTVSFFSGRGGYFYALISDGMGSGKEAAVSSRIAGVFLEKLLAAGADRHSALSLLNSYLSARDTEVFATVDLFEFDLYTGCGVLIKAGAAPSFVVRGNKCRKLQSATAPAGIIREIRAEQLSFKLRAGDLIVMASDGLCGNGNGEETESTLKSLGKELSTAQMADALLAEAIKRTEKSDDISVCVIKVIRPHKA